MFRVIIILAVAAAVPYVVTHGPNLDGIWPAGKKSLNASSAESSVNLDLSPQGLGAVLYPASAPLEGTPSVSLHDVFRFDISKQWVYQRWARKSTALAELDLFGVRVPLVTGTQLHDLAGSLTYYFSESGSLERISFTGRTGDTTQLVMLVAKRYGLQQQSTVAAGEQLFQIRREEQVFSELRTRPAPVLWANSPHDSFAVELELQRHGATTPLSRRVPVVEEKTAGGTKGETASGEGATEETAEKTAEKLVEKTPDEDWKSYSPRSRVPKEQVENLNRRGRFW